MTSTFANKYHVACTTMLQMKCMGTPQQNTHLKCVDPFDDVQMPANVSSVATTIGVMNAPAVKHHRRQVFSLTPEFLRNRPLEAAPLAVPALCAMRVTRGSRPVLV